MVLNLLHYEKLILEALTYGDVPMIVLLRKQIENCKVVNREKTSVGFYTAIKPNQDSKPLNGVKEIFGIDDVHGEFVGLKNGAGFILWVRHGFVNSLEGYTYEEYWPDDPKLISLEFIPGPDRDYNAILQEASKL